jgi:hypothetical protein
LYCHVPRLQRVINHRIDERELAATYIALWEEISKPNRPPPTTAIAVMA